MSESSGAGPPGTAPRSAALRGSIRRLRPRLGRRVLLAAAGLWAVLFVCAAALLPEGAAAPSTMDLELLAIHSALQDVQHEFIRPVSVQATLDAAWTAAADAAKKDGVPASSVHAPTLDGKEDTALARFDTAYRALNRAGGTKLDQRAIGEAAIEGLASSVHENHTYFIDPERWSHRGDTSMQYAGIGVTLMQHDNAFFAGEVYSDSPAAGAGLRPGDRIVSVDGRPVDGWSTDQLVKALRGDPGTFVTIELVRGDRPVLAMLQRRLIVVKAFESRVLDDGVGYLRLRSFPPAESRLPDGRTVAQALDDALNGFDRAGVSAWVLDLRGNGGGYLDQMLAIASRFLPSGSAVLISRSHGGESVSRTSGSPHAPARSLSVLVDGGSASASEILTAALQEHGRAKVVGEKSAGIANAANLDALPNGGGLSVTSVQSLTPVLRRPLDGAGVTPDVAVAASPDDVPGGKDRQLERAASEALAQTAAAPQAEPTP